MGEKGDGMSSRTVKERVMKLSLEIRKEVNRVGCQKVSGVIRWILRRPPASSSFSSGSIVGEERLISASWKERKSEPRSVPGEDRRKGMGCHQETITKE